MTRSLIAAAFLAGSLPLVASGAQDTVRRAGMLARQPSYSSLLSAIAATASATQRVTSRAVTVAEIRVVNANNVIGADNDEPVRAALETNKDLVAALRAAVGNNAAYTSALATHQDRPTMNDVIAVDILASGDVLVYFRKAP